MLAEQDAKHVAAATAAAAATAETVARLETLAQACHVEIGKINAKLLSTPHPDSGGKGSSKDKFHLARPQDMEPAIFAGKKTSG